MSSDKWLLFGLGSLLFSFCVICVFTISYFYLPQYDCSEILPEEIMSSYDECLEKNQGTIGVINFCTKSAKELHCKPINYFE